MKWTKFRHHYNKHLTWKTKHSTEEMDEEMTASLVNLPLSQPAPAPVLVQEDGVTLKDTEPSREPLDLDSELMTRKKETTREEIDEEGTASSPPLHPHPR